MPKQVDHAERRELLADAVWRVVMRDGIDAASLRHVAESRPIRTHDDRSNAQ